jgi:hypothetical protein
MAEDPPPPTGEFKRPFRLQGRPLIASGPKPGLLQRFGSLFAPKQTQVPPPEPEQAPPTTVMPGAKSPVAPAATDPVSRLTQSLGKNDEFMEIYQQLKEMPREQVVSIANEFNGPVAPSTTKPKALERILSRHRKLLDFTRRFEP